MTLFIDTHLNDVLILLHDGKEIVKKRLIKDVKEGSKVIMPTIKKILGRKQPDIVIVVNGPGSFTGVRLSVTIAKTMGVTMKIPVKMVTSLECLAISTDSEDKIVAFSDNNGYYIGIFDEDINLIGNYEYLTNKEYDEFSKKYNVNTNVELDIDKIMKFLENREPVNPHEVNPIYIKKISVEK